MHHPGEEYIYVLQGPVEIDTEFYDDALLLGVCSSADDGLMESLMTRRAARPPAPVSAKPVKRLAAKR